MTTKRRYIIRETDKRCVINGKQRPGIPLLVRRDGLIVAPVSRWLRTVALERDRTTTALTYADHLRMFWDFLDDTGTDWEHVDDAVLLWWRKQQEQHRKTVRNRTATHALRKTTINTRLGTVVAFYRWLNTTAISGLAISERSCTERMARESSPGSPSSSAGGEGAAGERSCPTCS